MKRIEERINRELREQLITVNTQNIGKGELKGIVRRLADNFHSCDTLPGMKFYSNLAPNSVPADARVDYVYTPTYLAYTGYKVEELQDKSLDKIAVLIDGEYIEERNNGAVLRGSDNQQIHILKENFRKKYDNYLLTATNQIQNFATTDGYVSVGIHNKGFMI